MNRAFLVDGFFEGETLGELRILFVVDFTAFTRACLAAGVDIKQLGGHIADFLNSFVFCFSPSVVTEFIKVSFTIGSDAVAADQMQVRHGHIEFIAARVFQL